MTARRPKGTIVTYYDGEEIGWSEAKERADPSYMRSVAHGHLVIDGLRQPVSGRAAGSFVNHSSDNNAIFWVRKDRVWIKLIRDVEADEEVFVDYGRTYWRKYASDSLRAGSTRS